MRQLLHLLSLIAALWAAALTAGCGSRGAGADSTVDSAYASGDTLRVVTLFGPTSFFEFRGDTLGYDYTLVKQLCQARGWHFDLQVVNTVSRAIELVDSGRADLIAYPVPVTAENVPLVRPCGPDLITTQVLVQRKVDGKPLISDVTDLVGHTVYVEKDSKYYHRMLNLNAELGGGVEVREIEGDSLILEDLVEMVSEGKLPLTVIDSDLARLNATYYHDLNVSLTLSDKQRGAWAVAPDNARLAALVDEWFAGADQTKRNADLLRMYYEQSKSLPVIDYTFPKGRISAYDALFKAYAERIGWDWRLLAAQGFVESRFDPSASSWAGAQGLMQIMPATARGYGHGGANLHNADANLRVAADYIADLDKSLTSLVPDDKERVNFVLAAYNCGLGHVHDAIRLARKYGLDPTVWDGNVAKAMTMKMQSRYYNDPVVRHGYVRGSETVAYVTRVKDFYAAARRHTSA